METFAPFCSKKLILVMICEQLTQGLTPVNASVSS